MAVAILNRRVDGTPSQVSVTLSDLGLHSSHPYHVRELFQHGDYGLLLHHQKLRVHVNPSGKITLHLTNSVDLYSFVYLYVGVAMFNCSITLPLIND